MFWVTIKQFLSFFPNLKLSVSGIVNDWFADLNLLASLFRLIYEHLKHWLHDYDIVFHAFFAVSLVFFFFFLRATIFSTCIHYKLNIEGKITYLYSLLRTDLDSRHFAPIVRFFKNLIAIVSGYGQKFIKHLLRALLLFKAEVSIV